MSLLALGINHNTASVALRERVAFGPDRIDRALRELVEQPGVSEAVIVSTCNRTELYCSLEQGQGEQVLNWLQRFHALEASEVLSAIYRHQDEEAVRRLMRVACGLDSLVLGGAANPGADQAILRPRPAGGCGERIPGAPVPEILLGGQTGAH